MDWIELELDKHKANAKADPKDWGYAGDLGHVREKLIKTLAFSAPTSNSGVVYFEGLDGEAVPWVAGEWHRFERVDLSTIRVKGTVGDTLTINGGTW